MPFTKIEAVETTDITNNTYNNNTESNDSIQLDKIDNTSETSYQCNWAKWNGIYHTIPELANIIDKKALWAVGKGYDTDEKTNNLLKNIKGNGKQTFKTILYNGTRVYTIGGDFFAEIILKKSITKSLKNTLLNSLKITSPNKTNKGTLINLKPLNPASIKVIANEEGIITRYEQYKKNEDEKQILIHKFNPDEIFHLPWNGLADSIHGQSTIEKLEQHIKTYQEAKNDLRVVFHRYVKPLWVFSVDTDDATEIADFKAKTDESIRLAENLIVPKGTVDKIERVSVPQYSTLDPLPWIKNLETGFVKSEGVPNIILGTGEGATEAASKILYLAFQQMIEWNQLFWEDQLEAQLGIKIKLKFPASIAPELIADDKKDPSLSSEGVNPTKDQK